MLFLWMCFGAWHSVMGSPHDTKAVIYGSSKVNIAKVPYMASVRLGEFQHVCAGSILHDRHILTAAHCLKGSHSYSVTLGISTLEETGDTYFVDKIFVHPNYSSCTYDFDVAVLRVTKHIVFKNHIRKMRFPTHNIHFTDKITLTACGWNKDQENENHSQLRMVRVPFIPEKVCQNMYMPTFHRITDRMLCAGISGNDTCLTDTGGPLVYEKKGLVGISSYGIACGDVPGVFTKIGLVKNWLVEVVENNP